MLINCCPLQLKGVSYKMPLRALKTAVVGVLCWLMLVQQANACTQDETECVEVGRWDLSVAIGAGVRTNPIAGGDNLPIVIIPNLTYYGKRFYLENYTLGYSLVEQPVYSVNLVLTPSYDQIYFQKWGLGNISFDSGAGDSTAFASEGIINNTPAEGMDVLASDGVEADEVQRPPVAGPATPAEPKVVEPVYTLDLAELDKRKQTGLGGAEFTYFGEKWVASLNVLQEVLNVHSGQEVRLAASQNFAAGKSRYQFATGLTWQSVDLLDYYFGAHEGEVDESMEYEIRESGITPFVRLSWSRELNEHWRLLASVHHKRLADAIVDSPLVEESSVTTVFIGGVYHF